jgi:hypothetical protein
MIRIGDIRYVKEIKFSLRNFAWTIIGGLLLNVVFVTTTFFVGISNDKPLLDIILTIPYAIMIASLASVLIFPFIDLKEYVSDKVMCRELYWDYEADFINKYSAEQLDKIRENYGELLENNSSGSKVKEQLDSFTVELERQKKSI